MSVSSSGYDMSTFIRRYSRYLNEKAFAYRQMAFDFGRVKKGYGFSFLLRDYFSIIIDFQPLKNALFVCPGSQHAPFLLALSIHQNNAHPTGVPFVCGMDSPPARRWAKCTASLRVLSAEMNTEWVITHALRGQLCLAGRHKVPPATCCKLALKTTNADSRIEIRHIGGYCTCDRHRQVSGLWVGTSTACRAAAALFSHFLFLPLCQGWGSDEDHDSREAVERNAHPAESDWRTAGFWCEWHSLIGNNVTFKGYWICWGINTVKNKAANGV